MFSTSPESPPLFIVDPTVLSRQLHRNNNLCVSERHDPRTEVARRPIWAEVARIRPAGMALCCDADMFRAIARISCRRGPVGAGAT